MFLYLSQMVESADKYRWKDWGLGSGRADERRWRKLRQSHRFWRWL